MSNKLKHYEQEAALNNALRSFGFPEKYFVFPHNYLDGKTTKHKFSISSKNEIGGLVTHTAFMHYEEMNCFLIGYRRGVHNFFNTKSTTKNENLGN